MPKQNSKYKKPSIPNYNPNAMTKEQRLAMKEYVKVMQTKTNAGNFNIRKSQ